MTNSNYNIPTRENMQPFVVDTIADLKNIKRPANRQLVYALGKVAVADGDGGWFYWDPRSQTAVNNTTVYQSNAGGNGRWVATINTTEAGFADAAAYGASPDATGLENAAAINEALQNNKVVTITTPGTYLLSSSTNAAITAVSGRTLAIPADGSVVIKGADGWRGYLIKGDNITDFVVDGGVWDGNGSNRGGSLDYYYNSGWNEHDIVFVGCSNITIKNSRHLNARRRCIYICGVKGGNTAKNITIQNVAADTDKVFLQFLGPLSGVTVRDVEGCGKEDDFIAFVLNDYNEGLVVAGGATLNGGNCENVLVENIRLRPHTDDATVPFQGIKLLSGTDTAGTTYLFKNVTIRKVTGQAQVFGVNAAIDSAQSATNANAFRRLLIEDIAVDVDPAAVSTSRASVLVTATDALSDVTLRSIQQVNAARLCIYLSSSGAGVLNRVVCDDIRGADSAGLALIRVGAGTVNHLSVDKAQASLTASALVDIVAATCNRLQIANSKCIGVGSGNTASFVAFRTTAGNCITQVTGCHLDNLQTAFSVSGSAASTQQLAVSNLFFERSLTTSPTPVLLRINGAGNQTVTFLINNYHTFKGAGVATGPDANTISRSGGTHTLRFRGASVGVDGTLIDGTAVEGDMLYNTNAAFGSGVGIYLRTGGAWAKQ